MMNHLISWALKNRILVLAIAAFVVVYGGLTISKLPLDVLPDLNRPTVTIFTEAHGLAPEEVETLVTFPIEALMNGAPGVTRVRSASGVGLSLVFVEFDWDEDIYQARQTVNERLQLAGERIPEDLTPTMGPISGIMGEVIQVGMYSRNNERPSYEVRSIADWTVRQRLLSVPGVSQVSVIGGGAMQYQVLADPAKLKQYDVTLIELNEAVEQSNLNTGGGFLMKGQQEILIRNIGRIEDLEDLENSVVKVNDGVPVYVKNVAEVRFGRPILRGDASVMGTPAVILSVQKQPGADTLQLIKEIERAVGELKPSLPGDIVVRTDIFRADNFINSSIETVQKALQEGFILVTIVLFLFLLNFRTTFISITAIPVSLLLAALTFKFFDMSVNTMTLGGLAVAIGVLVDDAIIDVENVYRRLKENRQSASPINPLIIVYKASAEVRSSIVFATLIIALVFLPLFALSGIEGRIFTPMALAFIVALFGSLLVSLTLTPVLCSYLLPKMKQMTHKGDPKLVSLLKRINVPVVRWAMRNTGVVIIGSLVLVAVALALGSSIGRTFLPPFNEGSYNVQLTAPPGTSLEETNRIGAIAEDLLLEMPEVESVGRRSGRAELDDHAEGVNNTEIELLPKEGIDKAKFEAKMRETLSSLPGISINIGQPISHRIDHMLSGIRAQIAVKIFGTDLNTLRTIARDVSGEMSQVPGVVDLNIEQQVEIPQIKIEIDREAAARYGLTVETIAETLETAFNGHPVSQVVQGQRTFDLVVWMDEESRNDLNAIRSTLIGAPTGAMIPVSMVADVRESTGPNTIYRENVQRRIVVSANVQERDLGTVINEIEKRVTEGVDLPEGSFVTYGGQFESQEKAAQTIFLLGLVVIVGIFLLLYIALKSWRMALQVMANLPLALVGGIVTLWITGLDLSIAAMVGFITLFGIATRNGIMLLTHYIHLMKEEGEIFGEEMILRGTQERLSPVLMTAIAAALGVLPFAFAGATPGKEIMHPVAVVLLGGLITSTVLNQVVTPALFMRFGHKEWGDHKHGQIQSTSTEDEKALGLDHDVTRERQ